MSSRDVTPSEPGPDAGVEELHADIAATREHLGETVAALGDKLDVKARAERKVADVEQKVSDTLSDTRIAVSRGTEAVRENARAHPAVPAAIIALVIGGLAVWVIRGRSRKR
jgi:hypothetical protein